MNFSNSYRSLLFFVIVMSVNTINIIPPTINIAFSILVETIVSNVYSCKFYYIKENKIYTRRFNDFEDLYNLCRKLKLLLTREPGYCNGFFIFNSCNSRYLIFVERHLLIVVAMKLFNYIINYLN